MTISLPTKRISVISQRKTFIKVLPTRWRRKPAGTEITSLSPYVLHNTSSCCWPFSTDSSRHRYSNDTHALLPRSVYYQNGVVALRVTHACVNADLCSACRSTARMQRGLCVDAMQKRLNQLCERLDGRLVWAQVTLYYGVSQKKLYCDRYFKG